MKKTIHLFVAGIAFLMGMTHLHAAEKTLKMGVDIYSIPFVYMGSDHKITGFEVEFVREIGKLHGFNVEIVPQTFPSIFDNLASGKIDFIGHIYHSKERAEKYLLSEPYYVDKLQFVALKDSPVKDILSDNITISTLNHSPLAVVLKKINQDHPNVETNIERSSYLAFKALFMEQADVMLATETGIHLYTGNYNSYQYKTFGMPEGYTKELPISFLTRKEDKALMQKLNDGIKTLKNGPTYYRLKEKYKVI